MIAIFFLIITFTLLYGGFRIRGGMGGKSLSKKYIIEKESKLQKQIKESIKYRLFPIISISQKSFSIFFLTLEKIGIDEKVICYHNIFN